MNNFYLNKLANKMRHNRANLWLVPSLIVLCACFICYILRFIDSYIDDTIKNSFILALIPDHESALQIFPVMGSSMITVAATVFAITIVALTFASTQFTQRILGNFMRSRIIQCSLGVFLGTFSSSLIILSFVKKTAAIQVPILATLYLFIMCLVGLGFLIFYIHHIFSTIQVSSIVNHSTEECLKIINNYFFENTATKNTKENAEQNDQLIKKLVWSDIKTNKYGFIQFINENALLKIARTYNTTIKIKKSSGTFVVPGDIVASIALQQINEVILQKIRNAYEIGPLRSIQQDIAFGIWEIVDIALKSMSSAINATSTSIVCMNYLTAILSQVINRQSRSPYIFEENNLRLIIKVPTFKMLLEQAFDQLCANCKGNIAIIIRLLHSFLTLSKLTQNVDQRKILLDKIHYIILIADQSLNSEFERIQVESYISEIARQWGSEWPGYKIEMK